MSRELDSNISTNLGQSVVAPFFTVDLLFDSPNELYFWSGIGDLVLNGKTYTGAGELLGVSELRESSDIAAYGASLSLSGIPNELLSLALEEPYQGRKAIIGFGLQVIPDYWNEYVEGGAYPAFVADFISDSFGIEATDGPYYSSVVFTGEMDQMNINMGPNTSTISLAVESRLVDLDRPRIRRYTDADQKSRYPNDDAFEFVTRLQDERLEWEATP